MKRTPLKRGPGPKRKTALRASRGPSRTHDSGNVSEAQQRARKRARARWAQDFGEHSNFVRAQGCQVCPMRSDTESHHEPPRSQGGTMPHQMGLCLLHHHERHSIGRRRFEAKHGVDLYAIRDRLWAASPHNPECGT